jgi:hypothetical protein
MSGWLAQHRWRPILHWEWLPSGDAILIYWTELLETCHFPVIRYTMTLIYSLVARFSAYVLVHVLRITFFKACGKRKRMFSDLLRPGVGSSRSRSNTTFGNNPICPLCPHRGCTEGNWRQITPLTLQNSQTLKLHRSTHKELYIWSAWLALKILQTCKSVWSDEILWKSYDLPKMGNLTGKCIIILLRVQYH